MAFAAIVSTMAIASNHGSSSASRSGEIMPTPTLLENLEPMGVEIG